VFESGVDSERRCVPILPDPALLEAYLRLFSTGDTLGVVAVGNAKDRYGYGPDAKGAISEDRVPGAVTQACAVHLLRTVNFRIRMGRAPSNAGPT
jgi:hypothetical protein